MQPQPLVESRVWELEEYLEYPALGAAIAQANLRRTGTQEHEVVFGPDPNQHVLFYLPGPGTIRRNSLVYFIHGGGWAYGDKTDIRFMGPVWIKAGYTVVSVNYRLAPADRFPSQIEDCTQAFKWIQDNIRNYGGDPDRIAVTGVSAGAHLAALLVTATPWQDKYGIDRTKIKCWIPVSGVHDFMFAGNFYHSVLSNFCLGFLSPSDKSAASPVSFVTGKEPPSLILHGGDDWLVPKTNSIELYQKLKEKGATSELVLVPGYWHCTMFADFGSPEDKVAPVVSEFLARMLPVKKN